MKRNFKQLFSQIISCMLIFVMFVTACPMVSFAKETLKTANIETYPTLVYREETGNAAANAVFYGQTHGDAYYLSGGVVKNAAGEIVEGEFTVGNPTKIPTASKTEAGNGAYIIFNPADTDAYSTIKIMICSSVKFYCMKTTPVAKENQTPLSASAIASGDNLAASVLTGGEMCNPYYADEPGVAAGTWNWVNPDTLITESGYYEAVFSSSTNYNEVTTEVYVEVEGSKAQTEIVYPSGDKIISIPYDGVTTMADLEANANALDVYAVEQGTDTVVPGTFTVVQKQFDPTAIYGGVLKISDNDAYKQLQLVFTPDDTENYNGFATSEPVTLVVTKGIPAWTEGERIVKYAYGATPFGQYGDRIEQLDARYLNCYNSEYNPYNYTFMLFDENGEALKFERDYKPDCGTYNYFVTVGSNVVDALENWDTSVLLPITIVIEPEECTINEVTYDFRKGEIKCDIGNAYLNGTVDLTVDGTAINGVKVTEGNFTAAWLPADKTATKDYAVKVVYNPAEDDNAVVAEAYEGTITYKPNRTLTFKHAKISATQHNLLYKPGETYLIAGDEVSIDAGLADFLYWTITDVNGNPVELEVTKNSVENKSFTFLMPDCDLIINASFQYQIDNPELDNPDNGGDDDTTGGIGDIDSIDGAFDWIMNLLNKIKAFFEKIIAFFQSIGDMT